MSFKQSTNQTQQNDNNHKHKQINKKSMKMQHINNETLRMQRQNAIEQLGNTLISNLDSKYLPYFDENIRAIMIDKMSEIIHFYENINKKQLKKQSLFNNKKQELHSHWNDICILLQQDYNNDIKLHTQKEKQQQPKQNKKSYTNQKQHHKKMQRQKIKQLKLQLAQNDNENNNEKHNEIIQNTTSKKQYIEPQSHSIIDNTNKDNDNWSDSDSDNNGNTVIINVQPLEEIKENDPFVSDEETEQRHEEIKQKELTPEINVPIIEIEIKEKKSRHKLRAPIICVMGDVDAGKTKILDCIRNSNIGGKEAGHITQQVGTTFISIDYIKQKTERLKEYFNDNNKKLKFKIPGLLFIDTPGHNILSNLRDRGLNVCDLAILVIDIHKGLQDNTIQTINMLKEKNIKFIVVINKIDLIYKWKSDMNAPFLIAQKLQSKRTLQLLDTQIKKIQLEFASKCGLNSKLYNENRKNINCDISLVPISAKTGEGISDLLYLINFISKKCMINTLKFNKNNIRASILEIKKTKGFGVTLDIILCNGELYKNDTLIICGINGPIITRIRDILLPINNTQQNDNKYKKTNKVIASIGVCIVPINNKGLEYAIPGSFVYVIPKNIKSQKRKQMIKSMELKVKKSVNNLYDKIDKYDENGVFVCASTLGTLESLINFLTNQKISVYGFDLGPITKKTVTKVLHKNNKIILAFNVKSTKEIKTYAKQNEVHIFESEIMYHLQRDYETFMQKDIPSAEKAIFPVSFCILTPQHVFRRSNPMVFGIKINKGLLCINTPICVKTNNGPLYLGNVCGIKCNDKDILNAKIDDKVSVAIQCDDEQIQKNIIIGKHFNICDEMISQITRESIDALKIHFKNKLMTNKDIISHLMSLKKYFGITSNVSCRINISDDSKNNDNNDERNNIIVDENKMNNDNNGMIIDNSNVEIMKKLSCLEGRIMELYNIKLQITSLYEIKNHKDFKLQSKKEQVTIMEIIDRLNDMKNLSNKYFKSFAKKNKWAQYLLDTFDNVLFGNNKYDAFE